MGEKAYYYLHTNGELIYKPPRVVDMDPQYFDSDFVRKVWHLDLSERLDAWRLMLESLAMGVRLNQAQALAERWGLTREDAFEMLSRNPEPTEIQKKGMKIFITEILKTTEDEFYDFILKKGEEVSNGR